MKYLISILTMLSLLLAPVAHAVDGLPLLSDLGLSANVQAILVAVSGMLLQAVRLLGDLLDDGKLNQSFMRRAGLIAGITLVWALPFLSGCGHSANLADAFPPDFKGKNVRGSASTPWATLHFEAEELSRVSNPELYYIPETTEADNDG
ncbi:MAG: hypothetical protein ACFB20_12700 [Opitutales bacterium]